MSCRHSQVILSSKVLAATAVLLAFNCCVTGCNNAPITSNAPTKPVSPKSPPGGLSTCDKGEWALTTGEAANGLPFVKRIRTDIPSPVRSMPYQITFVIDLKQCDETGFPDKKEQELLLAYEDALLKELESSEAARLVYVFTHNKQRHWLFYSQEDLKGTIEKIDRLVNVAPAGYRVEFDCEADPDWDVFMDVLRNYDKLQTQKVNAARSN